MNRVGTLMRVAINAKTKLNVLSSRKVFNRFSSVTTWNKDWKPGPYPRTEEERIAAAKKYNMIPEDYEPYPEEEGYGDYPKFPPVHMENRDPFAIYDCQVLKRNYGEPMHPDFDMCVEDKVNFQRQFRTPIWKQFLYVVTGVTIYTLIVLYGEWYPSDRCMVPKQYPHSEQKHYTFEAAD